MKIYTKFGDRGETALFDGQRVGKDDPRIDTYGTVDELNSSLGVAIAGMAPEGIAAAEEGKNLHERLIALQRELFVLGSDLATPPGSRNEARVTRIGPADIDRLERMIDEATAQLPPLQRFVLPGGSMTAARLHVARTVCRRAERRLVELMRQTPGAENSLAHALIYLNRLSDLLFTWARLANKTAGVGDVEWEGAEARKKLPVSTI
ncbi:MAG TPA: cob(I)yrinic acid a,c-diamide adenosyltransferase [Phycisphaerae bacterium]|nr:cob(I)yrinic acid a,c-diamide adenosyltransferase [Phycisphaerae bacterium]